MAILPGLVCGAITIAPEDLTTPMALMLYGLAAFLLILWFFGVLLIQSGMRKQMTEQIPALQAMMEEVKELTEGLHESVGKLADVVDFFREKVDNRLGSTARSLESLPRINEGVAKLRESVAKVEKAALGFAAAPGKGVDDAELHRRVEELNGELQHKEGEIRRLKEEMAGFHETIQASALSERGADEATLQAKMKEIEEAQKTLDEGRAKFERNQANIKMQIKEAGEKLKRAKEEVRREREELEALRAREAPAEASPEEKLELEGEWETLQQQQAILKGERDWIDAEMAALKKEQEEFEQSREAFRMEQETFDAEIRSQRDQLLALREGGPATEEEPSVAEEMEAPVADVFEPPVDAYEAQEDTQEARVDALEAPVDVYESPVDAPEAPVDAYEAHEDTQEARVDALEAPEDAYESPVDALEAPVDVYESPVDVPEPPVDIYESREDVPGALPDAPRPPTDELDTQVDVREALPEVLPPPADVLEPSPEFAGSPGDIPEPVQDVFEPPPEVAVDESAAPSEVADESATSEDLRSWGYSSLAEGDRKEEIQAASEEDITPLAESATDEKNREEWEGMLGETKDMPMDISPAGADIGRPGESEEEGTVDGFPDLPEEEGLPGLGGPPPPGEDEGTVLEEELPSPAEVGEAPEEEFAGAGGAEELEAEPVAREEPLAPNGLEAEPAPAFGGGAGMLLAERVPGIQVGAYAGIFIVKLDFEEVKNEEAYALDEVIFSETTEKEDQVLLDLSCIKYINSRGLSSITKVAVQRTAHIVLTNENVLKIMDMMGFLPLFTLFDTMEEALDAFGETEL